MELMSLWIADSNVSPPVLINSAEFDNDVAIYSFSIWQ
jgi:hypothetical protein